MSSPNYGDVDVVAEILNSTESAVTTRASRALFQAEALIDQEIGPYTTVPLTNPPQVIIDCSNDWAAGIIHDEVTNPTEQNPPPNVFIMRAKEALCRFLAIAFNAPCPFTKQISTNGGGGTEPTIVPYAGYAKSNKYKTDEMQSEWDE